MEKKKVKMRFEIQCGEREAKLAVCLPVDSSNNLIDVFQSPQEKLFGKTLGPQWGSGLAVLARDDSYWRRTAVGYRAATVEQLGMKICSAIFETIRVLRQVAQGNSYLVSPRSNTEGRIAITLVPSKEATPREKVIVLFEVWCDGHRVSVTIGLPADRKGNLISILQSPQDELLGEALEPRWGPCSLTYLGIYPGTGQSWRQRAVIYRANTAEQLETQVCNTILEALRTLRRVARRNSYQVLPTSDAEVEVEMTLVPRRRAA